LALLYYLTNAACCMFWAAFILTARWAQRSAIFLTKPLDHGGLAFSRPLASAVLTAAILLLIVVLPNGPESIPTRPSRDETCASPQ
jgi:uncharacterized membrane-anchored protein